MIEAEIADGNLTQITNAIQNALRPVTIAPVQQRIATQQRKLGPELDQSVGEEVFDDEESQVEQISPQINNRPKKPRIVKAPKVVNDLDLNTAPSLKDFISGFKIETNVDKYLATMLWFRDCRQENSVSADQIYTCFKIMGWSTATMTLVSR